jgi:hypothetical protein
VVNVRVELAPLAVCTRCKQPHLERSGILFCFGRKHEQVARLDRRLRGVIGCLRERHVLVLAAMLDPAALQHQRTSGAPARWQALAEAALPSPLSSENNM